MSWHDLAVRDADTVRDWYCAVLGWRAVPVPMDGYDDYAMCPPGSDEPVAGICHARGGKVVAPVREVMGGRVAVVQDPAGAVMALWEGPKSPS
jgi:predicted enzyme related to lactoylglutathione lyase